MKAVGTWSKETIMQRHRIGTAVAATAALLTLGAAPPALASSGHTHHAHHVLRAHRAAVGVTVGGTVAAPATYSAGDIAALPQLTLPVTNARRHAATTATGASLEDLVTASAPVLPAVKNALLRVAVTVRGHSGSVTLALGELDPSFGDNPALLTVDRGDRRHAASVGLVVPGDRNRHRSIADVRSISVAVSAATPTTTTTPGSVTVLAGHRTVTLSAARLAALPSRSITVSFLAGTAAQTHTEVGPTLRSVLAAARVRTAATTSVAGVGDDGYVAVVTPAEQPIAGKPLLISLTEDGTALAEPRLVVDGDVKGGRYVSGLLDLVVSSGRASGR